MILMGEPGRGGSPLMLSNLPRPVLERLGHTAVGNLQVDEPPVGVNDMPSGSQVRADGAKPGRHHPLTIQRGKKKSKSENKQMQTCDVDCKILERLPGKQNPLSVCQDLSSHCDPSSVQGLDSHHCFTSTLHP